MTHTEQSTAKPAMHASRRSLLCDLLLWSDAWREYYRLQTLDAAALRDVGLSEAQRASVTVSQIVARMRG